MKKYIMIDFIADKDSNKFIEKISEKLEYLYSLDYGVDIQYSSTDKYFSALLFSFRE